jgi:hypothetical protein
MAVSKIKCPSCGTEGTLSLLNPDYEGPYTCWKCRALFSIRIQDGQLRSWQALSQEELQRRQEAEALKAKFRRHSLGKD